MSCATPTFFPGWSSRSRRQLHCGRDVAPSAAIMTRWMLRSPGDDAPLTADDDFVVDQAMLADALSKARRLVAEMEKQQMEVEVSPAKLPPEQLAMGKFAFERALASARRMLTALEEAAKIAHDSFNPPHDTN